jgi:DNA-directed RNA polymerase subunit beta'
MGLLPMAISNEVVGKFLLNLEKDYVKAGDPLSDGVISPADILAIMGPIAVQRHLVHELQEVYRLQGVRINDKHVEVIVKQMMRKLEVIESGDTTFMPGQIVDKLIFREENDKILDKKVITDAGDSQVLKAGQVISAGQFRQEATELKIQGLKTIQARNAEPAVSRPKLQGITQASLSTESFISAASFQETTKVLSEASIRGKSDMLRGLKENVIVGQLIPAGTGLKKYSQAIIGTQEGYEQVANPKDAVVKKQAAL